MSRIRLLCLLLTLALSVPLGVAGFSGTAVAAEPQRNILLSTIYPSVTITKYQDVTLPIRVANRGEVDELINIEISSAPQDWEASLVNKESGTSYGVRSLYLLVGEEARLIYFQAKPPVGVEPGNHIFVLKAVSQDGLVESSLEITIGIEEKAAVLGRLKLTCTYPELRGQVGESFKWTVDVTNEGSEERTVNFSAKTPPGWEVRFYPGYEQTVIATMVMKAGETKDLKVELTPPIYIRPGDYVITIEATSGNIKGSTMLTATVLEEVKKLTYELDMRTPTDRLDTEAIAGEESYVSILVINRGSGAHERVNLYSTKPEGWVVTFVPEGVDSLAAGETREVGVFIKPTSKTLAGDYSVTLRCSGSEASADSIELRVAVGTATTWGWIGLAIVVVVIVGMVAIFWRLGRR